MIGSGQSLLKQVWRDVLKPDVGSSWSKMLSSVGTMSEGGELWFRPSSSKFELQGLLFIGIFAPNRSAHGILTILSINQNQHVRSWPKSKWGKISFVTSMNSSSIFLEMTSSDTSGLGQSVSCVGLEHTEKKQGRLGHMREIEKGRKKRREWATRGEETQEGSTKF